METTSEIFCLKGGFKRRSPIWRQGAPQNSGSKEQTDKTKLGVCRHSWSPEVFQLISRWSVLSFKSISPIYSKYNLRPKSNLNLQLKYFFSKMASVILCSSYYADVHYSFIWICFVLINKRELLFVISAKCKHVSILA